MKSRTISIIVAVTITLTLFVALAVCVLNPFNGSNNSHPVAMENKEAPTSEVRHEVEPVANEVEALINDSAFQKALSEALEEKLGDEKVAESLSKSIIETDAFKKEVASYLESADKEATTTTEEDTQSSSTSSVEPETIPLPEFNNTASQVSDDDYAALREESRTSEIEKALKYLGY